MVAIQSFRALRYRADLSADLTPVIAPPYDVIDPAEQEALYAASPFNVVRLILGKQSPADTAEDNRYTRAHRDFTAWRQQGVLAQDGAPALYLIAQTFKDQGRDVTRLGFIARLGLDETTPKTVFRHERTLSGPKADRTQLLDAVPANLEPIFCVFPDAGKAIQRRLESLTGAPPIAQGALHGEPVRLWAVTDPQAIEAIVRPLTDTAVLIADGHHRFEVAYARRARHPAMMSYFVSMEDPAIRVRPIHRILTQHAVDPAQLARVCAVEPTGGLDEVLAWLQGAEGQGCFGLFDGAQFSRVTVHPDALARWLGSPTVPLGIAGLDVSILHGCLLPHVGVDAAVTYHADAAHAAEAVRSGAGRAAWFLRGIPLAQVYALASQGLVLSPKSTYFYPKVPSGLVINPLD